MVLSESHMTFSSQPRVFRGEIVPRGHTWGLQWSLYVSTGMD